MKIRTYTEMCDYKTLEDRFRYLSLGGVVGETTFGFDRYLNQGFYTSTQWKHIRDQVIVRDEGCDLGIPGYEITSRILIHHMNPMKVKDIIDGDPTILDPEFLVCTYLNTHNAIHYGDISLLTQPLVERRPGDTNLWEPIRRG